MSHHTRIEIVGERGRFANRWLANEFVERFGFLSGSTTEQREADSYPLIMETSRPDPSVPTVLLIRTLAAQQNRSMERYADELGEALRAQQEFAVANAGLAPSRWAGVALLGGVDRRLARFVRYRRSLKQQQADLFHIIDHSYADLAAALPPERTIVTCHDLILMRAETERLGFRGSWSNVRLFRRRVAHLRDVAHVACISEQTRNDVVELVGVDPDRTSVIPNGIDGRFQPLGEARRRALGSEIAPDETGIVLHVSTGGPYKNVEGTLRTLAALNAGGAPVLLLRAGESLTSAQAGLAESLGVSEAIRDLGRVDDERLVELYNLADVLLFPSHYEGFGWPPLEAMACGTPVVTSEAAALLEVTGDAALHAAADDPEALAAAVRSILDDGALASRLTEAGIERAARYRWSETAAAFGALYRTILDGSLRRSAEPGR